MYCRPRVASQWLCCSALCTDPRRSPLPLTPAAPPQLVEPRHREALRCMRLEVLALEDVIPWNSVRRTWKTKVGAGAGERSGCPLLFGC